MGDGLIPIFNPTIKDHQVLIFNDEQCITKVQLLSAASLLANRFPKGDFCINLCSDRANFFTVFTALLLARKTNLMPQNKAPQTINDLIKEHKSVFVLSDQVDEAYECESLYFDWYTEYKNEAPSIPVAVDESELESHLDSSLLLESDHLAAIAFTSGSTGRPKPNKKYWKTLATTARLLSLRLNLVDKSFAITATVPSQHMYGLEMTVLQALQSGAALNAKMPFYPHDVLCTLSNTKCDINVLVSTPAHLRALSHYSSQPHQSNLDLVVSATAPLATETANRIESLFATQLIEIYGCTEAGSLATRETSKKTNWQMLDTVSFSKEQEGATQVSAPHLFESVELQDEIQLGEAQSFSMSGRLGDMINIGGKRASLSDLNLKLLEIDGVDDGVIFIPEISKEVNRPVAILVTRLSQSEIRSELEKKIDPVFIPRRIKIVDLLPRNKTGKISSHDLNVLYAKSPNE